MEIEVDFLRHDGRYALRRSYFEDMVWKGIKYKVKRRSGQLDKAGKGRARSTGARPPNSLTGHSRSWPFPRAPLHYLVFLSTQMPNKVVETPYPLIDADPHFSRVVRYMRPSDYAVWAGATAAFPSALYLWGKSTLSKLPTPLTVSLRDG
jgi:hypothetical protein